MTPKYHAYLQSDHWKNTVRPAVLQRDNHTCQQCRSTTAPLEVHHRSYRFLYREVETGLVDLVSWCRYCHHAHHEATKRIPTLRELWEKLQNWNPY